MPGFVTCGPNEALVISGCCHSKPYLMPGGRVFVWPWLQKIQKISLNTMTLTIESPNVYTKNGVPISLTGISQVKISGNNADKLLSASENFLGKTEAEIIKIVQETLEGHQREIMAKMSVEKIYCDRKDFSKQVYQVASSDLADMGLVVVSYTVKDIHDEEGYLEALGLAQTAKVRMDAKIGEVDEFKDRKINELNADKERFLAKYKNDTSISKAQHDFDFKKAEFDISIYQEQAKSDLANKLQEEIGKKFLVKEMLQIKIENNYNSEQISKKEKEIKALELESKIKKLAEKEFEKSKIIADAEKEKIIEEGDTEYEVIKTLGEAQAYGLEKISEAQTDIMALEANVFSDFKSAACINMMLDTLPKIAAEISDPVAKCNKITMVSQGDGEIGVNKFVTEILSVMQKVYTSVNELSASTLNANIMNDTSPNNQSVPPSSSQQSLTTNEAKKSFLSRVSTTSSPSYIFKT